MTNQAETHVNTRQTYQTERSVQIDHHADHTHPESGARVGNLAHCAFSSAISGNARIFGGNPLIWNYQVRLKKTTGQFSQTTRVTPFVVIPGKYLGHGALEDHGRRRIHDRRMRIADDVD